MLLLLLISPRFRHGSARKAVVVLGATALAAAGLALFASGRTASKDEELELALGQVQSDLAGRETQLENIAEEQAAAVQLAKEFAPWVDRSMAALTGEMTVVGWKARRIEDGVYLVSSTYKTRAGEEGERGWYFEVQVPSGIVRSALNDPELSRRYGLSPLD